MISGRALHFVFKVADRTLTAKFYRDVLGMKVLRHEEFSEGCEATCNGPYANRWSKTMIGYGPEDTHFVVELTYNYGITHYDQGNDFLGLTIQSSESLKRAAVNNWPIKEQNGNKYLEAPGGYKFYIIDKPQPVDKDPVVKVSLASSNLAKSIAYWNGLLTLKIFEKTDKSVLLGFSDDQAKLELVQLGEPINRAKAYGRIAFSCPFDQQPLIDKKIQEANGTILTPLISLDTPGKATVRVIILADPDGHEICFVDDESFRQLSQVDPNSDADLDKKIQEANGTILTRLISLDTPGKATVRVIILADDPDGHEICFVDDESFRQLSQVDPNSDADLDKYINLEPKCMSTKLI